MLLRLTAELPHDRAKMTRDDGNVSKGYQQITVHRRYKAVHGIADCS